MTARSVLAGSTLIVATLVMAGSQGPDQPDLRPAPASPAYSVSASPALGHIPAPSACTLQNLTASLRPQGPLPAPGQMPAGATMARILQRGYLIAGIDQETNQFAFRDTNLRLVGFDIDVIRDITEAIFGDREHVVFRPLAVADRVRSARSDQVDLVVATLSITCQRREQVRFSNPYYVAAQRVLVNRGSGITGLESLGGKPVCAPIGSTPLQRLLAAPSKPLPVGAVGATDCLMLLQLGEVDAVSTDDSLLAGMAAQDPRTEVVGPRLNPEPYGVAINKDTPDLVRFVNAVLERRVQDGRWRASYERWLQPLLGPPPALPPPQYGD